MSPIAKMFDRISPKYDRLNHILSFNIDKTWRRKTVKAVVKSQPETILDLATGTADLAIALAKYNPQAHIIGVDFSERMLAIGKEKVRMQELENQIDLYLGDAAALPFENQSFDTVTVAFGVRNFEDLQQGLSEICRVLKPKGRVYILEFSMPEKFPIKQAYQLYFKHILPKIGKQVSKDAWAYSYLPESVERFPKPLAFKQTLNDNGLHEATTRSLTWGIATLYTARKK